MPERAEPCQDVVGNHPVVALVINPQGVDWLRAAQMPARR